MGLRSAEALATSLLDNTVLKAIMRARTCAPHVPPPWPHIPPTSLASHPLPLPGPPCPPPPPPHPASHLRPSLPHSLPPSFSLARARCPLFLCLPDPPPPLLSLARSLARARSLPHSLTLVLCTSISLPLFPRGRTAGLVRSSAEKEENKGRRRTCVWLRGCGSGLAGALGRSGRGAPKSGAPGWGAGRCKISGALRFKTSRALVGVEPASSSVLGCSYSIVCLGSCGMQLN